MNLPSFERKLHKLTILTAIMVICGNIAGLACASWIVSSHHYLKFRMFRLLFDVLAHNLNKWLILSVLFFCSFVIVILALGFLISRFTSDREKGRDILVKILSGVAAFTLFVFGGWAVNYYLLPGRFALISLVCDFLILGGSVLAGFGLASINWISLSRSLTSGRIPRTLLAVSVFLILSQLALNFIRSYTRRNYDPEDPNIVLVVFDTVKSSNLSCYGYGRNTTPGIDRIAEEGTVFDNAYCVAPWTVPNHASIFTGLYVAQHGATQENTFLDMGRATTAEILYNNGYETVAFINNVNLTALNGFDQGFESFHELWREEEEVEFLPDNQNAPDDAGTFAAVHGTKRWFDDRDAGERPFFLFLNFMEAHIPYNPPDPFKYRFLDESAILTEHILKYDYIDYISGRYSMDETDFATAEALYDGGIAYMDSMLCNLIEHFEKKGVMENTLLIITSDHGEFFGEHDLVGHQFALYNTLLHIPLIIRFPSEINAGNRSEKRIQLIDLFSTMLDAAGYSPPIEVPGTSIFEDTEHENLYAEYYKPSRYLREFKRRKLKFDHSFLDRRIKSLQSRKYKFIHSSLGNHELFNLRDDPGETLNLVDIEPAVAAGMEEELNLWFNSIRGDAPHTLTSTRDRKYDKEMEEALRSIGYVQ